MKKIIILLATLFMFGCGAGSFNRTHPVIMKIDGEDKVFLETLQLSYISLGKRDITDLNVKLSDEYGITLGKFKNQDFGIIKKAIDNPTLLQEIVKLYLGVN